MGLVLEIVFFTHFFMTGMFSGYLWAGLMGAFFAIMSMILLILMIVSDTLSKIIMNQEEILYYSKKREYYGDSNMNLDSEE